MLTLGGAEQPSHPGRRGKVPKLIWVPLFSDDRRHRNGHAKDIALGWSWVQTNCAEIRRIAESIQEAAMDPDAPECGPEAHVRFRSLLSEVVETLPVGHGLSPALDAAVAEVQSLASDALSASALHIDWTVRLQGAETDARKAADLANGDAKAGAKKGWFDWVNKAVAQGKRAIHQHLRAKLLWVPSVVRRDDQLDATPAAVLTHEAGVLQQHWRAEEKPLQLHEPEDREAFPLVEPTAILKAALTFPAISGAAVDGFHPRQMAMLSEGGLQTIALLFRAMEKIGRLPEQLIFLLFVLIPKQAGGVRPIALMASLYRLWTRLRRAEADEWILRNDRAYFAVGKGRSPEATVWRQAVRAERAVGVGRAAATVLQDMRKFYEKFSIKRLAGQAVKLQVPSPLMKLPIAVYQGPRIIRNRQEVTAPMFAECGLPAGCGLADFWVRVYCITAFDAVVLASPRAEFDFYIDDLATSAVADTEEEVHDVIVSATTTLLDAVHNDLEAEVAKDKAATLASSPALAKRITASLGPFGGPLDRTERSAVNLGIDYAPGVPRGKFLGGTSRRRARVKEVKRRKTRLKLVKKRIGGSSKLGRFFLAGAKPALAYGTSVHGVSPTELHSIRRALAAAKGPFAQGTSLTHKLALNGDDSWNIAVSPALAWAAEVWRSISADDAPHLTTGELFATWHDIGPKPVEKWQQVRGPVAACHLCLDYIDWSMPEPFVMLDDRGEKVVLTQNSPALVGKLMQAAMQRKHERSLGDVYLPRGGRICTDILRTAISCGSAKLTCMEKGIVKAWACGAVWTRTRAADAGFAISKRCELCNKADDTVWHRLWECTAPQVVEARKQAAPWWATTKAKAAGPDDPLFAKGMFEHPEAYMPQPFKADGDNGYGRVRAATAAGTGVPTSNLQLRGSVYVDGSCTRHPIRDLSRAGFSVVMCNSKGGEVISVTAPVWAHLPQTPQASEYCAVAGAVQLAGPNAVIHSDCSNVVRDMTLPYAAGTASRKMYAGITRDARTNERFGALGGVVKVPAHVKVTDDLLGIDRVHAIANDVADRRAKQALDCHDAALPELEKKVGLLVRDAKMVIRVAAATLACWPKLPRGLVKQLREVDSEGSGSSRSLEADVVEDLHGRADSCQLTSRAWPKGISSLAQKDQGHRLRILTFDSFAAVEPVIVCEICGAYASRRFELLGEACHGAPRHRPAAKVVSRVAAGLHPVKDAAAARVSFL